MLTDLLHCYRKFILNIYNKLHQKFDAWSVLKLCHLLLVQLNCLNIPLLGRVNSVKQAYKHTVNSWVYSSYLLPANSTSLMLTHLVCDMNFSQLST